MTAPRKRPPWRRVQRMIDRLSRRYNHPLCVDFGTVQIVYFRPWLNNGNVTDEDMQSIAEYCASRGLYSCARVARLACFLSKTSRRMMA